MVRRNRPVRSVRYPGRFDAGHAWAYLPDVGETVARLLDRESELAPFDAFHIGGHYLPRGVEMAETLRDIARNPKAPIEPVTRTYMRLVGPFEPKYHELLDHRHLWKTSKALDNTKLVSFLGEEPRTDFRAAVRTTLSAMGCMPRSQAAPEEAA
jgi:nucleoside-diphosphate-sugar epimerase